MEKLVADSTTDLSAFDLVSPYESTLTAGQPTTNPPESIPELNPEEAQKLFNAPPAPTSILDALEQRLAKYEQTLKEAQGENNSGKVRRLGRIVKNYECAIKAYKQEKPYDYESLPTPPGFAEIPFAKNEAEPKQPEESNNKAATAPVASSSSTITVEREAAAAIKTRPTTKDPLPVNPKELQRATSTERKIRTTAEKQTNYLIERQRQFKLLALEAKQKGDIEKAKEYLRNAKGFDPLIEASRSGLPIDVSSIPTLPDSNDDFVIISQPKETNYVEINDDREEMFRKLEMELTSQITVINFFDVIYKFKFGSLTLFYL